MVKVAAGLTTIIGFLFLLSPNYKPSTISTYEFKNLAIERGVTLGQYIDDAPVPSLFKDPNKDWSIERNADKLTAIGTVVLFDSEVRGRPRDKIALRWLLFDATTKKRLGTSLKLDPLCGWHRHSEFGCLARTPNRLDNDIASFQVWVDTSPYPDHKCFFIRLEAFTNNGSRLTSKESDDFPSESAKDGTCGSTRGRSD